MIFLAPAATQSSSQSKQIRAASPLLGSRHRGAHRMVTALIASLRVVGTSKKGALCKAPFFQSHQAAFRFFTVPTLLPCAKCSSSSPFRTAAISVSMIVGSLSLYNTTIADLPLSNSNVTLSSADREEPEIERRAIVSSDYILILLETEDIGDHVIRLSLR